MSSQVTYNVKVTCGSLGPRVDHRPRLLVFSYINGFGVPILTCGSLWVPNLWVPDLWVPTCGVPEVVVSDLWVPTCGSLAGATTVLGVLDLDELEGYWIQTFEGGITWNFSMAFKRRVRKASQKRRAKRSKGSLRAEAKKMALAAAQQLFVRKSYNGIIK